MPTTRTFRQEACRGNALPQELSGSLTQQFHTKLAPDFPACQPCPDCSSIFQPFAAARGDSRRHLRARDGGIPQHRGHCSSGMGMCHEAGVATVPRPRRSLGQRRTLDYAWAVPRFPLGLAACTRSPPTSPSVHDQSGPDTTLALPCSPLPLPIDLTLCPIMDASARATDCRRQVRSASPSWACTRRPVSSNYDRYHPPDEYVTSSWQACGARGEKQRDAGRVLVHVVPARAGPWRSDRRAGPR
jgi:hypothetical protein